ncbi:hypothetical protein FSP39_014991 [Pinctada imbricata]|uniref:Methyltransferase type 11 domain-containing protein n=1 Tax=Pinctada imbricata TaxID=66713 RepID=A0AA88XS47_PINIB|nr:hypothetical protein FSP39_014991 [Pinctada imbricata]
MSNFTNYTEVSADYDVDRKASASDVIVALIQTHLKKNLSVLHHLEKSPDGIHYDQAQKTLEQAYRILKPGGILAITTGTPTLCESCWIFNLHEDVLKRYKMRFMSVNQLKKILTESGFKVLNTLNVTGREIFESYTELEGPLRPSFRNNVSYFAEATPDEVEQIISLVTKLKDSNELQNFYDKHDKSDEIGLFAFCISRAVK